MKSDYILGNRLETPCKDCPDRQVGCHGSCLKYAKFLQSKAEFKGKVKATSVDVYRMDKKRRIEMLMEKKKRK